MTLADVMPLVERLSRDEVAELHETTGRWLREQACEPIEGLSSEGATDDETAAILDERLAKTDANPGQWVDWESSMHKLTPALSILPTPVTR